VNHRAVVTDDGVELALFRMRAHRDGRPALLLVHGAFVGHRIWLRRGCAAYFEDCGLDVWLADLRHHGASAREPSPRTWRYEDWILSDAPALVRRVRQETVDAPVAWLGHSSGGAVGLCAAARGPADARCDAIVTFGTPGPRRMSPLRWAGAAAMIGLARAVGRFPARALGVGSEDEAADILADWLAWNVRGRWLGRDGYDYWTALRAVAQPYLAVAGASDRLFAPPAACRQVVQQIGSSRRELSVHPRLTHRGLALSARARDTAWRATATWLLETLAR
jgi:oxygen-independent coproporphyrinogen-3 oxidase